MSRYCPSRTNVSVSDRYKTVYIAMIGAMDNSLYKSPMHRPRHMTPFQSKLEGRGTRVDYEVVHRERRSRGGRVAHDRVSRTRGVRPSLSRDR